MSTSEPNKDEAPASAAVADSSPPETAAETETAVETKLETKPESEVLAQPAAAADQAGSDEPVWPPPESQPAELASVEPPSGEPALAVKLDEPPTATPDEPALLTKLDEPNTATPDEPALLTKPDEPLTATPDEPALLTKPDEPPAATPDEPPAKPGEPAAEPSQEMGLSESTLHWLVDGEQPIEASEPNPVLVPIYDPRAPVAGRKRTFGIIGGAAVLSLGIAWALHALAAHHGTTSAVATVDSADLLIHRAEAALAEGRSAEALDLAHLAIVTDARMADAYIVMGVVQRSNGQVIDARDSYRRYLELAPIGTHAAEARAALTSLPP
jgi:hypothetical protein